MMNKFLIAVVLIGAVIGYFVYDASTKPKDKIVKQIANKYRINYSKISDIKIVKSYENRGKLIYILNIKNSICEMPMIEIDKIWTATGIDCKR